MQSCLLQDWTTLSGDSTAAAADVIQDAERWQSLAGARELMLYLQCTGKTGTPRLFYETSPNRDTQLFRTLAVITPTISAAPTITSVLLWSAPSLPVAKWVRWRVKNDVGAGVWSLTLRITLMPFSR